MDDIEKVKVAVAGATGMIGGHLVAQLLIAGYKNIVLIVRNRQKVTQLRNILLFYNINLDSCDINIIECSLYDLNSIVDILEGVDILYDCAAIVSFDESQSYRVIKDNVRMTQLLCESALRANIKRFIYVSSIATLSSKDPNASVTESDGINTIVSKRAYDVSKFFSENEVWRTYERGLNVVVVNPAVVIGYGDINGDNTPRYFKMMQGRMPFYFDGVMGYVSAEDVSRAMITLSTSDGVVGKRFILCSDNLSYKDLFTKMAYSLGVPAPNIRVRRIVIKTLAFIVSVINKIGIRTMLGSDIILSAANRKTYDGTMIQRKVGFKYSSLDEYITRAGKAFSEK